jgi:hypothetical protein
VQLPPAHAWKYGFVERAEAANGKERPWRKVARGLQWTGTGDSEAARALATTFLARDFRLLQQYLAAPADEWPEPMYMQAMLRLTLDEGEELGRAIFELLEPYFPVVRKDAPPMPWTFRGRASASRASGEPLAQPRFRASLGRPDGVGLRLGGDRARAAPRGGAHPPCDRVGTAIGLHPTPWVCAAGGLLVIPWTVFSPLRGGSSALAPAAAEGGDDGGNGRSGEHCDERLAVDLSQLADGGEQDREHEHERSDRHGDRAHQVSLGER